MIVSASWGSTSLSFLVDGTMNDVDSGLGGLHLRRDSLGSCSRSACLNGGRTSELEDKVMAAGQHEMEVPLLKFPDPHIGPLRYGDTSHALSDGLDPPKIRGNGGLRHHRTTGRGYGRGCTSLPHE